jgi:hypothetical protein
MQPVWLPSARLLECADRFYLHAPCRERMLLQSGACRYLLSTSLLPSARGSVFFYFASAKGAHSPVKVRVP